MIRYLAIIQARLTSTRLPGKVLMEVGGIPIVKRVWLAAKGSKADKTVVAWPERYPDLDQNNVLERFRRISREFPSKYIIRLTADCPLLTSEIINEAIDVFETRLKTEAGTQYYCNRDVFPDGFDVQIFTTHLLHNNYATHKEHVIQPEAHTTPDKYLSVDTKIDLERVREWIKQ
jgi:spore coat polysaccharide biosynthesis protein SpsF (cytidylyltransferase family)